MDSKDDAADEEEGQKQHLLPHASHVPLRPVEHSKLVQRGLGCALRICTGFCLVGLCVTALPLTAPSQLVLSMTLRLLKALVYGNAEPQVHLVNVQTGLCLDWNATIARAVECRNESISQVWMYGLEEQRIRSIGGRCLDAGGSYVHIWECMYPIPQSQQWVYDNSTKRLHQFVNTDALCLTANGTAVWLEPCNLATRNHTTNQSHLPVGDLQWELRELSRPAALAVAAAENVTHNIDSVPVSAAEAQAAAAAAASAESAGSAEQNTSLPSENASTTTIRLPAGELLRIVVKEPAVEEPAVENATTTIGLPTGELLRIVVKEPVARSEQATSTLRLPQAVPTVSGPQSTTLELQASAASPLG